MRTSQAGIDLVKTWEGFRSEAYQDSAGVWTIGYGTTRNVKEGDSCTEQEAEAWLARDLKEAEHYVNRFDLDERQGRFDALVSFTYNLGPGWIQGSGLKRAIDARDWPLVPMEITRWVYAGGKPLLGLARRRVAEAALFVG